MVAAAVSRDGFDLANPLVPALNDGDVNGILGVMVDNQPRKKGLVATSFG